MAKVEEISVKITFRNYLFLYFFVAVTGALHYASEVALAGFRLQDKRTAKAHPTHIKFDYNKYQLGYSSSDDY